MATASRHTVLSGETRSGFYLTVFGVWGVVAAHAVLHDQYLVRIAPEHFTVCHENVLNIAHPALLAVQVALAASVAPGFVANHRVDVQEAARNAAPEADFR